MSPKLYWFSISPFARFVLFFAKAAKIDLELHNVNLGAGEQKKPEFLAINPHGQIPALDDDGFKLFESAAIVRYLAAKHPSSIYNTSDAKKRGIVDAHYELIKSKLQDPTGKLVFESKIKKAIFKQEPNQQVITDAQTALASSFSHLESHLFKENPKYVVGSELSLADIILGVWLSQLEIAQFDLTPYPKTKAYYESFKTCPIFIESHAQFYSDLKILQ